MKRELLDEIMKGVEEKGNFEISVEALDTILGQGDRRRPKTKEQILLWAVENGLRYEYEEKNETVVIRFLRG